LASSLSYIFLPFELVFFFFFKSHLKTIDYGRWEKKKKYYQGLKTPYAWTHWGKKIIPELAFRKESAWLQEGNSLPSPVFIHYFYLEIIFFFISFPLTLFFMKFPEEPFLVSHPVFKVFRIS